MRSTSSLAAEFSEILREKGISKPVPYIEQVVELIRERAHFVKDFWELSDYFFTAPAGYDQSVKDKFWKEETPAILTRVAEMLSSMEPFTKENIEHNLSPFIKENGWQMGAVMNTLRLAMVGASKGPGVADIMALTGKEETVSRIEKLVKS